VAIEFVFNTGDQGLGFDFAPSTAIVTSSINGFGADTGEDGGFLYGALKE